jgi:hypothetical protein
MDDAERELFATSLGHATERHTGDALDAALDGLGWTDALSVDPRAAVSLLFERQGAANATSSALDRVVLDALGVDAPGVDTGLGPGLADAALVLPPIGSCDPPGDGSVVRGLGGGHLARRPTAVVVVRRPGEDRSVVAATVPTADLTLRTVHGMDPALGLVEVAGSGSRTSRPGDPGDRGETFRTRNEWDAAVAAGQRALAHELVGAARSMLRLARDHAVDRVQFGRPIGSFQAVRHRLADTLVAIEAAEAALQAAWDEPSPVNAALAKAVAGRGALTAARHCQQVLAGIGFTTEHPLHHHTRRARVLDQLLGDTRTLTRRLGDDLVATRTLPALLPL